MATITHLQDRNRREHAADSSAGAAQLFNTDLEAGVIGAILRDPRLFPAASYLRPEDFSIPQHQEIWKAVNALLERGVPITPATSNANCSADIRSENSQAYIRQIVGQATTDTDFLSEAARIIGDLAYRRTLIAATGAASANLLDLNESASSIAATLESSCREDPIRRRRPLMTKAAAVRSLIATGQSRIIKTSLRGLDHVLGGGLHTGRLVAIGGDKGAGKTILTSTISYNLDLQKVRHLVITLERQPTQIEQLSTARALNANAMDLLEPSQDLAARMASYARTAGDTTIYEHMPSGTIDDIRRAIHLARRTFGIAGFLLDYFQLIAGRERGDTEESHFRRAAQILADLCAEFDLFGIATSAINKEGDLALGAGLKRAASAVLIFEGDVQLNTTWLRMTHSNYTRLRNVGAPNRPGIYLNKIGPHFSDVPTPTTTSVENSQ
jgi:replicative DNA helicase